MAYPTYRQDFEGGSTLATACPELVDIDGAYAIDTAGGGQGFTGAQALRLATIGSNHTIISSGADTLGGGVKISVYLKTGSSTATVNIYGQGLPLGAQPTTYQRATFGTTGLLLVQNSPAGGVVNLNTAIAGVSPPANTYICLELCCNGTAISARAIRQSDGFFFVHSGSGSWQSAPTGVSGTATLPQAAGAFGLRLGDPVSCWADDLIYEPAVPATDFPTLTLSSIGATQQLTAGGFTDPLFGKTWASSNTGIATVNSAGLVTAVANGTCTITATGKRDTGQTATTALTVGTSPVTLITSTPPTPASGYAHNPSAAIAFALGAGTQASPVTVTPTDAGGGGTFAPTTLTLSNTTRSGTVTYRPAAAAVFAISCTNSGGLTNPATFNYTGTTQGLAVSPASYQVGTAATASFTGTGTLWLTTPPTITAAGIPCTVGPATVTTNTACTALVTPGASVGTVTFTDSTTGGICTATVGPVIPTYTYLASIVGFASGLSGTVGYTVLDSTGATYAIRSTAGVFAVGTVGYAVRIQVPATGQFLILWDDGSGHQTFQETPSYTGGPVASVVAPVTLPPIPTNWITPDGIAAAALAGKGDWLTPAGYTAPPTAAATATAVHTTQMVESYNADGVSPTLAQALYLIMQRLIDFSTTGPLVTVRKIDGTTTAYQLTYTLDTNQNPTAVTRSS